MMGMFNLVFNSQRLRKARVRQRAGARLAAPESLENRQMLTGPTDDVTLLSDEFNDATSIVNWSEINEVEGWGPAGAQLNRWNVDTDQAGQMVLQPHTGGWYEDWRGALVFKEIAGDFVVTSRVQITDRDDVGGSDPDNIPDDGDFSLGGLMIRTPRNITNGLADWQPGNHADDGTNNGENYIFLSMGFTTGSNNFSFEVKSTRNSTSNLQITTLGQSPNEVEFKIARIGSSVITLYRLEGEQDWTVHRRYSRPDMPETLQVGMVAYTDWEKLNDFPPPVHNGAILAPGQVADPTPWQPFNPDLTAAYDYTRFTRPTVPNELIGVNLVTEATNEQLLSFLGDAPVVEEEPDPDPIPGPSPTDDITLLNDEFNDPTTIDNWSEVNETEGWGERGAQLDVWNIDTDQAGQMVMQPHSVVWYEDWRGPLVYKEIAGDFVVTTRMQITDRDDIGGSDLDNVPGDSLFSLGGLMIRTPRDITNGAADWQPGSQLEDGTNNGENYIFLSMGYTTGSNNFSFEVKTTRNSDSNLEITPLGQEPNEVELRVARIGTSVFALYRLAGEQDWTVHRRYTRTDMPEVLQVGMVTYSDWEKANDLTPIEHNGSVVAPGQIADPTPWQPFNPDLTAAFDYARFVRPSVPVELNGMNLVTDATDEQLLSFLGDPPVVQLESVTDDLYVVLEDAENVSLDVLANDDVSMDALITSVVTDGGNGLVNIAGDGRSLIYTPQGNFAGEDSFEYVVTLSDGQTLNGSVTVAVTAVNDAPVLVDAEFHIAENSVNGTVVGSLTAMDFDSDPAGFVYSITAGNELGIFAINASTGEITVANNTNLNRELIASVVLTIEVSDGDPAMPLVDSATVTIQIDDVNEFAPVVTSSIALNLQENLTRIGSVSATDADLPAQAVTYAITGGADAARFNLSSTGSLSFKVAPDFENPTDVGANNIYDLIFTAYDGAGLATPQAMTVQVRNVLEAPVLKIGGPAVTWINRKPSIKVLPQLTVGDEVRLGGGTLNVEVSALAYKHLIDVFTFPSFSSIGTSSGPKLTLGGLSMQIQLSPNVTAAAIQSFLRKITFETKGLGLLVPTRTLSVTLATSTGEAATVVQTIHVKKKA